MIASTAPTGTIGRQVLANVRDGGEPIRAIARDPAPLPADTRTRAEVVQGSHGDPGIGNRAFAGADAVGRRWVKREIQIPALGRGLPVDEHAGFAGSALAMDESTCSPRGPPPQPDTTVSPRRSPSIAPERPGSAVADSHRRSPCISPNPPVIASAVAAP